jgi:adenylate cyclase
LRQGDKVRITAQLVHANPERHLWSASYERSMSDVIALQREVTQTIVGEIRVSLTPAEQQRLAQARPVSPQAYEACLKGYYFLGKNPPEGVKRSVGFFQQAIRADAAYAPGYVGLAESYIVLGDRDVLPPDEAFPKAWPLIVKALSLDDSLSEAHNALAGILDINRDWGGAEREYLRAIEVDPGNSRAHHWYSMFLVEMGRIEEALTEERRARQLDPGSRAVNAALSFKLTVAGRYDEAVEQAKASLEMDENSAPAHFALGLAYTKKGMREEAATELRRAVALTPGYSGYMGALAYSYGAFGQTDEACRVAEEMKQFGTRTYVGPTDMATAYAACGRNEEALRWLEAAYRTHDSSLGYIKLDYTLDKLRSDPRFQDLLRRMNFPQ